MGGRKEREGGKGRRIDEGGKGMQGKNTQIGVFRPRGVEG